MRSCCSFFKVSGRHKLHLDQELHIKRGQRWWQTTVMWSRRKQRHGLSGMPRAVNLLPILLALLGYAFAGLSIWPSLHVALSNPSVFVDFITKSNISTVRNTSLSLVNMETNTTIHTRTIPNNQWTGRVEFGCSHFLYAGTFRFLLMQTSYTVDAHGDSIDVSSKESTSWLWSSELQVQWPTFHIAVERAGNHSGSFQVGISTNEHFQACSRGLDSALFLEVSYVEYNQIGRKIIDKVRARTQHPIKPLRSQSIELSCAFPFTEKDFIRVALESPHTAQEVKSSGPLYLSRIFSYKLLVENANAYKSGCEGTMTVKLITPPCAHINGKVLLYKDAGVGKGVAVSSLATNLMGFGPEEPSSPPLAFHWLTHGEDETEFNCSVFEPGRNKYCFRFVFNFSRSPSPAQTCLVVHKRAESWGPWQPWSVCSVSCGDGVRERVRKCLLPSSVGGMQCTGMVKEQSLCSLEDCVALPDPSPSLSPKAVGVATFGSNVVVVVGISLCLTVILATIVVAIWRKFCQTPQCSAVRRGSMHSPGGRKLSDENSICGHSLQRPSLTDGQGPQGSMGVGAAQKERPSLGSAPLSQTLVMTPSQDPDRLSPTGQKVLPPVFGYRLAQQQLKEMKKKGLKEAIQLYHVSSSPVHDTLVEASALPTNSPIPTPTGLVHSGLPSGLQDDANHNHYSIAAPFPEPPLQISRVTPDRLSPRVDLVSGAALSTSGGSSKWRDRTAHWVEMVERSGLAGHRGEGGGGDAGMGNQNYPNFRRTASFNDTKPPTPSSAQSRNFRERSMTHVGSRTLPEGSCLSKGGWERQPYNAYPIPEHGTPELTRPGPQRNDQRKPWLETAAPSRNSELKHTGANPNCISASEKDGRGHAIGTAERQRSGGPVSGGKEGLSGIGGLAAGPAGSHGVNQLSIEQAEINWNRRGPSPIQRNILARKLKEAQSCSGINGRQRSSTFSAPSSNQRKGRCHSLQMSGGYSNTVDSPYRLSEKEQRMLDLDMSSS